MRRGGEITAAIRSDPSTFNAYVGRRDTTRELLTHLLHARLVRVNRATGEAEPWLAESWTGSDDGLTWTLKLRQGITFSDGAPFTSQDVLFAFEAITDPGTASALKAAMQIEGEPIAIQAPDDSTLILKFPSPYGPGLTILDNLPILPRHKLEPALRAGILKDAWSVRTPPGELVGLGPFKVASYRPGERIVLDRNSKYWRRDDRGTQLPYLDRLTLDLVRDQNTEMLRFEQGQIDIPSKEIRAEDYSRLRALAQEGKVRLADAGVGLDANMLWFNLSPEAHANDSRKPWLQSLDFRKAISSAVDRQALVDTVLLGSGAPVCGPVTPGNKKWFSEVACDPFDPSRARALLTDRLGFTDKDADGMLEDGAGRPVRFSILTQQGETVRMRSAAVIQQNLRRVGITVDVVALDFGSVIERFGTGQYDAIYLGVEASSYDPAHNLDFWLSSGSFHVWNPEQRPATTPWEKQVDELMHRQAAVLDHALRYKLFAEVQQIFARQMPILYFAAPRVVIALSPRLANVRPVPLKPFVLWNADTLAVTN
jgi:peptide/nickel transport system substrate-binding protein